MRRLALFCVVVLLAVPARAQDDEQTRATLRGLKGVRIVVEDLSPALSDRGITTNVVLAEVQLPLRQAAIPIDDDSGRRPLPGDPVLNVQVLASVDERFDQCAFAVRLELRQNTQLERDHGMAVSATTWSTGGLGEAGKDWRQVLREELAYYAGVFVEAWQAANNP